MLRIAKLCEEWHRYESMIIEQGKKKRKNKMNEQMGK